MFERAENNELSGNIPTEFCNLRGLLELNLRKYFIIENM